MSKEFPDWEEMSPEDLVKVAKFISNHCYGHITLNMNDTFAYACAWGVDVDVYDVAGLIELDEMFGHEGVTAWASIVEKVDKPIRVTENFLKAKEHILANRLRYFWSERFRAEKGLK